MANSVEDKYVFNTAEDSVRDKDWAAGSSQRLDSTEYVFKYADGVFSTELVTIKYPPALWKIFDEIVVRCGDAKNGVTYFKVTFERNGWIKVTNDGPGIEICEHKVASEKLGRKILIPEFVFGMLFQGSNKTKDPSSIIGGTNGFGSKITNTRSVKFIVETVDMTRKLALVQVWKDGMRKCNPPAVVQLSAMPVEKRKSHTTVAFLPDYKSFNYPGDLTDADYDVLNQLFLTRTIYASAYANYSRKKGVDVTYNDILIPFRSVGDIAVAMFPDAEIITTVLKPGDPSPTKGKPAAPLTHPWEVCAVLAPTSKVSEISIVDGVVVRSGKHTKYLMEQITTAAKEKVAKLFNEREVKFSTQFISNNVFLLVNAKIPCPSWDGQRKDVLEYDTKRFKVYTFPKAVVAKLADAIHNRVSTEIFNKIPTATGRKHTSVNYDKYRRADLCGTKHSLGCSLIVVEGDSAMSSLKTAIVESIGYERVGIICTGGVIMNARKKSAVTQTVDGQYVKKTEQLEKNIFFTAFCKIVGLNTHYRYQPGSASYKKEMSELNYGEIWGFVDQDLDGKGNILGSFLSVFEYWWPNLLAAGFVKWFCSPIIRAYPKRGGKVIEFYSTNDYHIWAAQNAAGYRINYYKGIGTHSREEAISMVRKYKQSIYTYTLDDQCKTLFNVYFGSEPNLRKIELATPAPVPTLAETAEMQRTKQISCSNHLRWETKPYQQDNLERKLDHIIDGQNQAGRKILDGLMKAFNADNDQIKVAVLAGFISERENYHHGEASLSQSITRKGFIGAGAKQLPQLRPMSNFGTRLQGGNDASDARYIFCKENRPLNRLLFPQSEYQILEFNFDEGERSEPKYFVPIIPLAILESTEVPGHGWKIKTWARDVFGVIDNVVRMITLGADCKLLPMRPAKYEPAPYAWTGSFRHIRGKLYAMGTYKWINNTTLQITELPLREWTESYVENLRKKATTETGIKIIASGDSITDSSSDMVVNIKIALTPGAKALLDEYADFPYCDGVEEFFSLRTHMDDHLNFMGADGGVRSFETYEDVLREWFPVRMKFYRLRIERELVLMRLRAIKLQNMIRYARDSVMKLPTRKLNIMLELLNEHKYDKLDTKRLSSPDYMPTDQLMDEVLKGPHANYDYLLDLSDRAKSEERIDGYVASLDELQAEITTLELKAAEGLFYGSAIWLDELEQIRNVITEGFKTTWRFGDFGKFTLE
jgi:DNA topoisomerase II